LEASVTPSEGITVAVIGGTGFTGRELCRLLLGHPAVTGILPTSRGDVPFGEMHPNLLGSGLQFATAEAAAELAEDLDVVFFCTPSGEAMRQARHYLESGARVIDLSADFRFADPGIYRRVYGEEHADPELLGDASYGVTELYRSEISRTRLVANPGCYAITAVLGLTPLLRSELVDPTEPVAIHAVNGTTGAGNTPQRATMHAEVAGTMLSYNLDGHRHGPELEAQLAALAGHPVPVDLNTTHGDFARGIHLQANVRVAGPCSREELLALYTDSYGDGHEAEHFVLVNSVPRRGQLNEKQYGIYPSLRGVVGSNYCHIGLDRDDARGIVKIIAVTDNLGKGAAGSALQNMNVMLGLEETLGLRTYAL
jgi:N-acetyl-gamma-glutamyl-phosphate reductase common form